MTVRKKKFIIFAVILAASIFFLLPKLPGAYVRAALESEFSARFECSSQTESFRGIYFKNVTLKNRNSGLLMLEAERVWIKTGFLGRLNFLGLRRKIHFENPVLYLQKGSTDTWNWLPAKSKESNSIDAAKARQESLSFEKGKLRYKDASAEPAVEREFDFLSAQFSYKPGGNLTGALKILESPKKSAVFLFGFTYEPQEDSLTFQVSSSDNKMALNGTVRDFSSDFYSQFSTKIRLKQLKLLSPEDMGFAGFLTVQAEGASQGSHPKSFFRHLSLNGAFDIRHGTLLRENIIAQILRSLKPVASLTLPAGTNGLTPDYQGLIKGADTAFQVFQTRVEVSEGLFHFDGMRVKHPEYYLEGEGTYDIPNGKMDFRSRFVPLENFSSWFVKENPAFKAFQNEKGRLVFPFLYRGLTPDIELEMDWDQISAIVKDKQIKEAAEKRGAENE